MDVKMMMMIVYIIISVGDPNNECRGDSKISKDVVQPGDSNESLQNISQAATVEKAGDLEHGEISKEEATPSSPLVEDSGMNANTKQKKKKRSETRDSLSSACSSPVVDSQDALSDPRTYKVVDAEDDDRSAAWMVLRVGHGWN